ncbi:CARDB domain-containing protein [Acidianus brierleyi]|uniref:CARDB domain-containing protein n=1 Tax=Acidianus brierleyi TaxID=41673 RepID=A0A2U9IDH9_9CREN|nr:CARDB domain-containing protein [Acidianus brierleyi]AWR94082.1 hypothetical protein DFR85_05195 [Acidianus brierleyi]
MKYILLLLLVILTPFIYISQANTPLPTYTVTFVEHGLPTNSEWSVTVTNTSNDKTFTQNSSSNEIVFTLTKGFYSFKVSSNTSYVPSPSSGYLEVYNSSITENITFSKPVAELNVTQFKMENSNTGATVSYLTKGTPYYLLFYIKNYGNIYAPVFASIQIISSSNVIVSQLTSFSNISPGLTQQIGIQWIPNTNGIYYVNLTLYKNLETKEVYIPSVIEKIFVGNVYPVVFKENGLPIGTQWKVNINGSVYTSNEQNLTVYLPDGTYTYEVTNITGYQISEYEGTFTVNNAGLTINLVFKPLVIIPEISEFKIVNSSGVPAITFFVNGQYNISFVLTNNGNETGYIYTIVEILNSSHQIVTTKYEDVLLAPGQSRTIELPFVPRVSGNYSIMVTSYNSTAYISKYVYNFSVLKGLEIIFKEIGLPEGQIWNVTLNGVTKYSNTDEIIFYEPPGSYSYVIGPVNGFTQSISSGSMFIISNKTITIQFTEILKPVITLNILNSSLQPTEVLYQGKPYMVSINVSNEGNLEASFIVEVYVSYNNAIVVEKNFTLTLMPKETKTLSINFTPTESGKYLINSTIYSTTHQLYVTKAVSLPSQVLHTVTPTTSTVPPTTTVSTTKPSSSSTLYIIIAIVIVIIIIAAIFLIRRK